MPTANLPPITHEVATRATLDKPAPTALQVAMDEALARFSSNKPVSAYHGALLSRLAVDPRHSAKV
jgi:hypothetical protein